MVVVEDRLGRGEDLRQQSLVASNAAYTVGQSYTGYWHIGWGYEAGWTDPPTSGYLNGTVSEVAVIPTQLSVQASRSIPSTARRAPAPWQPM